MVFSKLYIIFTSKATYVETYQFKDATYSYDQKKKKMPHTVLTGLTKLQIQLGGQRTLEQGLSLNNRNIIGEPSSSLVIKGETLRGRILSF